jgi:two-component system invasion response regulator UvrY
MPSSLLIVGGGNRLLASSVLELLEKDNELQRVTCVDSHDAALTHLKNHSCSLLIDFFTGPQSSLLKRLERFREFETKVMLVIPLSEKIAMPSLSRLHVDGLLCTEDSYQEFRTAINVILKKKLKYVSPYLISAASAFFQNEPPFSRLSQKELDVALFIMNGDRNSDIAAKLNISHKTVSTYKARIFRKLQIMSDVQLYIYAQASGLQPFPISSVGS